MIPVCFKRKLSYSGSYLEEWIDKEKVRIFYSWLRKYNHLYRDTKLDMETLDTFVYESMSAIEDLERINKKLKDESDSDESDHESSTEQDKSLESGIDATFVSDISVEKNHSNDQSQCSLFMNKYCEDPDLPSIANRLADVIIAFEIDKAISNNFTNDEDFDDELVTEEDFINDEETEDEKNQDKETFNVWSQNIVTGIHNEICNDFDSLIAQTEYESKNIQEKLKSEVKRTEDKMSKICIAPGEDGKFMNWSQDIFLEEKAFPEKFPYGIGGYLSSMTNSDGEDIGFASYCVGQLMSCDPKFRQDIIYVLFLLLVKELIELKRCKVTFLRQATRLPKLSKDDVLRFDPVNLNRYNRTFEVFKKMRGTSMYFEHSKKNLMALLRQKGCPTAFLTLSCAEFDWPELLREIVETVERRKVSEEYIANLSTKQKNKLISENFVQSTIHFQKRIEKIFTLMKGPFFKVGEEYFHVKTYYYRVEFQQRGAPHIHSLIWMKSTSGIDAPSFWVSKEDTTEDENWQDKRKKESIERFANILILTSPDQMSCKIHDEHVELNKNCTDCKTLCEKVQKYQTHHHTFSCAKKHKTRTINEYEGHGRLDGIKKGIKLSNIPVCRFGFPKFPSDETKLIAALSKDADEDFANECKKDLNKILKYLQRQTYNESHFIDESCLNALTSMTFYDFLYEVGMFDENIDISRTDEKEMKKAKKRYILALSSGIRGRAVVLLKREVKDIFVNGYCKEIMRLHLANIDIQICIDPHAVTQYILGYLMKNEAGQSRLLKAIDIETNSLSQMEKLNALSSVLDKHREVSCQEAVYRILGLPMTKSSVVVKYLSTVHPDFRDGLLKSNIEEIEDNESLFHNSASDYYQARPNESNEQNVIYNEMELADDYWENLSLAEFWSQYDIVYCK